MRLTRSRPRVLTSVLAAPRRRSPWAYAFIVATLALIFIADRRTEAAPLQHLYYLPIVLSAAWFGMRGGLATALAAVLLYHAANPRLFTEAYKDTDLVQIALFFAIGAGAAKLAADGRRLHHLATTDDLTGLHNLRSFEGHLTTIMVRLLGVSPVSLLVLDVDRLKSINDTHGHLAGAEAVRTVGRLLAARLPHWACACRYGGDEFVVALPGLSRLDAGAVADDIRQRVHALAPTLAGVDFPSGTLSVSIGVACLDPADLPACGGPRRDATSAGEALFRDADKALYEAKHAGRNRVAGAEVMSAA